MVELSVILPTFNPDPERLRQALEGLIRQTLLKETWELLLVDNASSIPVYGLALPGLPVHFKIVREPEPGLSNARRRGFNAAQGNIFVLVDDDNVLAPDYLEKALDLMRQNPRLGLTGGKSFPVFEKEPEVGLRCYDGLLAVRDLGEKPLVASWSGEYPECSPIGAGMVLRREAVEAWLDSGSSCINDRKGRDLSSGGDNDIVLCSLKAGWQVSYDPELALQHLIPALRTQPDYLARLNHGIQKSWMQVLYLHGINPWSRISRWTIGPRKWKAWFGHKAWSSPAAYISWRGACGHFEGRVKSG